MVALAGVAASRERETGAAQLREVLAGGALVGPRLWVVEPGEVEAKVRVLDPPVRRSHASRRPSARNPGPKPFHGTPARP